MKEGALADLLLVDGNPLENPDPVADPDRNFVVIMKDGVIYKNTTDRTPGTLGQLFRLSPPAAGSG